MRFLPQKGSNKAKALSVVHGTLNLYIIPGNHSYVGCYLFCGIFLKHSYEYGYK